MTAFFGLLLMLCLVATPILAIIFLVKWVRKKPKKKIGIWVLSTTVGIVIFTLLGVAFDPSTWCEHQYEIENKIEATCTEEGYTSYHCQKCDDVEKKDKVVTLEHDFKEISSKEATENSKGEIVYKCSVCNITKISVLDKLSKGEPSSQEKPKNEITASSEESKTSPSDSVNTTITYEEIYTAYKKNELRADETYQYNCYRVTAKINGMETGGLLNLTGGATLTMEVKIGNTIVFFYAEFEKDQEENLKNVNVGDTITFDGKCLSAGTWSECELIE